MLRLRQSPSFPHLVTITLILSLMLSVSRVCAQDIAKEIARHQEKLLKLYDKIDTTMSRIRSSSEAYAEERAYMLLDMAASRLLSAHREFAILGDLLMLADLVTEKRAIPIAKQIIDRQMGSMIMTMPRNAAFIEKFIRPSQDQETTRLLLEARDLLRVSVEIVRRLWSPESAR